MEIDQQSDTATSTSTSDLFKGNSDDADHQQDDQQQAAEGEGQKKYAGKFDTPEDMEKAYLSLQQKIGSQQTADGEGEGQAADAQAQGTDAILARAELTTQDITEQYTQFGRLTDQQYKALQEKAGIDRATVDGYLAGQAAQLQVQQYQSQELRDHALQLAGGEESYQQMSQWAKANLSEGELNRFNQMVDDNASRESVQIAMEWLVNKYQGASGNALVDTSTNPSSPKPQVKPLSAEEFKTLGRKPLTQFTAHERARLAATDVAKLF